MSIFQSLQETKSKVVAKVSGLESVVEAAGSIPGWIVPPATREVAIASYKLPENPTIVEVGAFMGRSTALLAGARRLRGSGVVHAIDPFDCSGDGFSISHYEDLLKASGARTLEEAFRSNMRRLGLENVVEVYTGTSSEVVANWTRQIDLLLLDGDQTPHVQRRSYELWIPFLKSGGTFIMHNVGEREYAEGHDGSYLLAKDEILPPRFSAKRIVQYSLFAIKN